MSKKAKVYAYVFGIVIMISILIAAGMAMHSRNAGLERERAVANAYILYNLLNSEILTAQSAEDVITPAELSEKYSIPLNDRSALVKAEVSYKNDEYEVDYFEYYDCQSQTAYIYNEESNNFDVSKSSNHKLDKSEISVIDNN